MKLLLLILGVVVVTLNLLLWFSKKQTAKAKKADESPGPEDKPGSQDPLSMDALNIPEIGPLKQSAAAELGITIEQLDRLSAEEIEEMAMEKGLL